MDYEIQKNGIYIIGKEDFNPKHILECGQIFRYEKNGDGSYVVYSRDLRAKILETSNGFLIETDEPAYFEDFFNLKVDYAEIKNQIISKEPTLRGAVDNAQGLRILKGDLFEILVSFIISANNNIKRIKLIISRLCEKLGKRQNGYFAFPTPQELERADEDFFKSIGAGYRSAYLAEVKTAFDLLNKEDFSAMSDIELRARLMKIKGVGPKVADCILLFAFNRKKIFPVDVWMERVYYENWGSEKISREKISKCLTERFQDLSGYVQQYMFYSKTVKNEN